MLKLVDDFNPKREELNTSHLLRFTYLHSKIEVDRKCDLQSVVLDSVSSDNIWKNWIINQKERKSYDVFIPDKSEFKKIKPQVDYYPELSWFEVSVLDYPGRCLCILKWWPEWIKWSEIENTFYPNIKQCGIVVDFEEWEEGLNYMFDNIYDGPCIETPKSSVRKNLETWVWVKSNLEEEMI